MKNKSTMFYVIEMLGNVLAFLKSQASRFPADSIEGRAAASIAECLTGVGGVGELPSRRGGIPRSQARNAARSNLLQLLDVVRTTVSGIELDHPGTAEKFRLLDGRKSDTRLIKTARDWAIAAVPIQQLFVEHRLHVSFFDELDTAIDTFEQSIREQSVASGTRTSARTAFENYMKVAMVELQRLDAIIPNALRGDDPALEAWWVARKVKSPKPSRKADKTLAADKKRPEEKPPDPQVPLSPAA